MSTEAPLPPPDAEACAHSARLLARIRDEAAASGWLSFARYMELALYAPGLGYYSAGAQKFGAAGDFVTAPEMSPLFAQTLARQVAEVMAGSAPAVLEVGAGSGAMAVELLRELDRLGSAPAAYGILEVSAELRQRQAEALRRQVPELCDRVSWHERLPDSFSGVVLANEVLDAMPVHLLCWQADGIAERGIVAAADGSLAWSERPAAAPLTALGAALPVAAPYLSEVCPAARAWVGEWGRILGAGALILIDYGFPRREYYHPQRAEGTLMCHYRHRAHTDPLYLPGLCDITAHVDFTAIAEAGAEAGLEVLGYTSQATFLLNCGIAEILAGQDAADTVRYLPMAAAAGKYLSPAEMGELFKVMVLGRGRATPLTGFARGDRTHAL